jgi:hypothetical protein
MRHQQFKQAKIDTRRDRAAKSELAEFRPAANRASRRKNGNTPSVKHGRAQRQQWANYFIAPPWVNQKKGEQ